MNKKILVNGMAIGLPMGVLARLCAEVTSTPPVAWSLGSFLVFFLIWKTISK